MKKLIKRLFGGLLNLFKSPENPLLKAPDYSGQKISSRGNYKKMGPLEIDTPVDNNTYGPYNLPGVTVTAPNLKKALPFPYGQINVEANNGRTLAYPTGTNPLQEAVFRNKAKKQFAYRGKLMQHGGAFNLTKIITAQTGDRVPKLNEWKFRRTTNNLNNGYKVILDLIMLTIENGQKTYDTPPIVSGRTIYMTPKGNDTIYYRNKGIFDHTPIGDKNLKASKSYFYKMIKYAPIEHSEYKGTKYWTANDAQVEAARNRAIKGYQLGGVAKHQEGGFVEMADNTRVSSGRPQLIKNKIPYGAGKGPAADSPMRLFNDPYINMGLMAMAPVAVRQHRNGVNYAPPTMKDIINNIKRTGLHGLPVNPEVGIPLNTLMKYTGKSPEQINNIMLPKYGDMRIETLPNSKRQIGIWRIKGDKDLVLNEVLELLR